MLRDNQVHVIGHDGESVNREFDLRSDTGDATGHGPRLDFRESYRRILQRRLDGTALGRVVWPAGDAPGTVDEGRRRPANFVKMVGADLFRAAAAGIVRGPETVGADDEVCGEHVDKCIYFVMGVK